MPVTDKTGGYLGVGPVAPSTAREIRGIQAIAKLMGKRRVVITWKQQDSLGYCTCSREVPVEALRLEHFKAWMNTRNTHFVYDGYGLLS